MSFAEYSLVFISILVGYIVTVIMSGWGELIKHFDRSKFSALYLLWSLSLFFYLLFIWLWAFKGYNKNLDYLDSPTFLYYIIIRLLLMYFAIATLTPDKEWNYNFKSHFLSVSKRFYIILIILWSYELLLYPLTRYVAFNPRMLLYLINLPISVTVFFVKSEKIEMVLAVIFIVVQILANLVVLDLM